MDRGIAFLTEDRRVEGLMMEAPIADNIALPSLPTLRGRLGAGCSSGPGSATPSSATGRDVQVNARRLRAHAGQEPVGRQPAEGRDRQVAAARPGLFILDEPTRGIDVGAKYEVYKIINRLAADGTGILMISSEIEELIGMCDRILVMGHGEIRGDVRPRAVRPRGDPAPAPCGTACKGMAA